MLTDALLGACCGSAGVLVGLGWLALVVGLGEALKRLWRAKEGLWRRRVGRDLREGIGLVFGE